VMTRDLAEVRDRLGAPGASVRAAHAIHNVMTAPKDTHRSRTTRAAL